MKKSMWLTLGAAAVATTSCQRILGIEQGTLETSTSIGGNEGGAGGGSGLGGSGGSQGGAGGFAPEGPWSCLGDVGDYAASTIVHRYEFTNSSEAAVTGFDVQLCASNDPQCASPVDTYMPDGGGILMADLAASFSGFLEFQSANSVPYLLELGPRTDHLPSSANRRVPLYTTAEIFLFFAVIPQMHAAGRGVIGLFAHDCDGLPTGGVNAFVDDAHRDNETATLYFDGDGMRVADTKTVDGVGAAVIVNVLVGDDVEITTSRAFDQAFIGKENAHVRPDGVTVLFLGPTKQ